MTDLSLRNPLTRSGFGGTARLIFPLICSVLLLSFPAYAQSGTAKADLWDEMQSLQDFTKPRLVEAREQIRYESETARVSNLAQTWHDSLIGRYSTAFSSDYPVTALVDAWALSEQVYHYLTKGDGKNLFEDQQEIMQDAVNDILTRTRELAHEYLPPDRYKEVETSVQKYVTSTPFAKSEKGGGFSLNWTLFSVADVSKNALSKLTGIALLPTKPFTSISQGTEGLYQLSQTADRFTTVVDQLPEDIRQQVEQLLDDLMENQTSISLLLADVQGTLQTLDQTLVHSDTLTSNVNTTLRVARPTLQDATAASEAAARAADNGRALVDSIGVLLRQIEESGDDEPTSPSQPFNILDYKRAAEAIAGGAAEVAVVLEQVLTLIEMGQTGDEPSADEESSFDILDYAETARALESASKEVQVLLSQAQEFAREPADPGVSAGDTVLGRTLAYSSEQIRELINAAVIRLALLVLLIFVLAVVYLCIKRAITQTRK